MMFTKEIGRSATFLLLLYIAIFQLLFIMTTIPTERFNKLNWFKLHNHHCTVAEKSNATTLLIGDSIVAGLSRYPNM